MLDFDLGIEEVGVELVKEPTAIEIRESKVQTSAGSSEKEINWVEIPKEDVLNWDDTQETILNCYIADGQEWGGPELTALSKRLKLNLSELEDVIIYTTKQVWDQKRVRRLLEIESTKMRGYKWDHIEQATLAKLEALVDSNKIVKPGELLMIASTANRAQRRGSGLQEVPMPNNNGPNQNVQVNIFGQPSANQQTDLPGAGPVGTVKLNLSQRTIKQLSNERVIDSVDYERLHDRAEMLKPKDIVELSKLADEKND